MRPDPWNPPVELSAAEQAVVQRIKRAKLFTFLRRKRHELVDAAIQAELSTLYQESGRGAAPTAPAKLALVTLLQAYTGASDDEALEALVMDRRWQLMLDCLDAEHAPFGKGALVRFRRALIAKELDRRLIERTVELALRDVERAVSPRQLRAALDSSPLWGAGRVEDTYNLLGHALRKAVGVLARRQGRELAAVAADLGAEVIAGSSLKAALDLDWDDPEQQARALAIVLGAVDDCERRLAQGEAAVPPGVPAALGVPRRTWFGGGPPLAVAHQVAAQDVRQAEGGRPALRQGVAPERRISVEDADMRHGRKSKSLLVDGYKRHVARDLDRRVIVAVGVTAANAPEATVTDQIAADLAHQAVHLSELHIDRAYLSSTLVRDRPEDLAVYCQAWPVQSGPGGGFPKTAFRLEWETGTLHCPNHVAIPFRPGTSVQFPADAFAACPLRSRCTSSVHGRSITIHPDERLLQELWERQQTPAGRAKLRERVAVEHALAHIGAWQGRDARYVGLRKNLFDLRRTAAVQNLHIAMYQSQITD